MNPTAGPSFPIVIGAYPQQVQFQPESSKPAASPALVPRPKRKRDELAGNNTKRLNKNDFEHVQWNYTQALEKCLVGASDMYFDDVEYEDLNFD